MSAHLEEHELTAAMSGLTLDEVAREHLKTCLVCRRQVAAMGELIGERRREVLGDEPDWQAQHAEIMARLPETAGVVPIHRQWLRPLLAAAASLVLAVGAVVLYVAQQGADPAIGSDQVEQILAEVEETLNNDEIPGFGTLGGSFFESEDSAADAEDGDSSAWDVALAALSNDDSRYEVPGFEAMGILIPSMADLESMYVNDTEAS